MNLLKDLFKFLCNKILGKKGSLKLAHRLIFYSDQTLDDYFQHLVDSKYIFERELIRKAYKISGIDDYGDEEHTGELYFLQNVLKNLIDPFCPIIFDVGANVGNYSVLINTLFPKAKKLAFEPNPDTYEILKNIDLPDVQRFNIGFGKVKSISNIYSYRNKSKSSEHASILKDVFTELYNNNDIISHSINIECLDDFCSENNIPVIDFLKIDTEGFEYEVLSGAGRMINENRIKVIQIEFNEMNIISKVFLKDFYNLLSSKYNVFRLTKKSLLSLDNYDSFNEIFKYQNLIFINKKL